MKEKVQNLKKNTPTKCGEINLGTYLIYEQRFHKWEINKEREKLYLIH